MIERAILIAGPTAGGKSALALALAERHRGVVINADAMAVYRDLRIVTGRPTDADERRAPHALFGHVDAGARYSVGRWMVDARAALTSAWEAGRLPIVVGGTGLYLKALTQGLSDVPPIPDHVRAEVRAWTLGRSPGELHALLSSRDPETARRLRPTDPQRILRALEVLLATGHPLVHLQASRPPPMLAETSWFGVVLAPDRGTLRAAVDARFEQMMAQGALAEVAALTRRRLDPMLPAMRALGVPPLAAHLAGALTLAEAVARAKAETRRYAKRQTTFARHQLVGFDWADRPAEASRRAEAWIGRPVGARPV